MPTYGVPPTQSALLASDKTKMSTDWINYTNNITMREKYMSQFLHEFF